MGTDSVSDNPLDQLRLSLMQDVLPVGLAVLERARRGGPGKVAEVFTGGSDDPIADAGFGAATSSVPSLRLVRHVAFGAGVSSSSSPI